MFNPSSSSVPTYSDPSMHQAVNFSGDLHTAPTEIPRGSGFFHGNGGLFSPVDVSASPPPSYISSLLPYNINTSTSSHSLPFHLQFPDPLNGNAAFSCPSHLTWQLHPPPVVSSPSSSSGDFFELSRSGTMRRVLSTGDLQGKNVPLPAPIPPQFPGDNCSQEGGDPFSEKVGRYSAEERKERIERYRAKRQQRNFHKKITYACRKTLADSRPRVQGRFARNVEAEGDMETEASDISYEYCPYNDLSGGNRYGSQSQSQCMETVGDGAASDDSKWWWGTPVAANKQQQQLGFDVDGDDEYQLWASLADMC
ncbi:two-component response regulator-like APRR5 [Hordeum vulgare subsp. vulgare]|uniref:CCT domain-containing protein n=2 Tax=Hordeum vulgare subsp. vulgare TaxID=112509 RepID=A0A8I6WHS5_HORVV|nr:two-component response regulator-like APRR5 [Hordeum vulgare subsp. vulgare]